MTPITELPETPTPIQVFNLAFDEALDKHGKECIKRIKKINFRNVDNNIHIIRSSMIDFHVAIRIAQMAMEQAMRAKYEMEAK